MTTLRRLATLLLAVLACLAWLPSLAAQHNLHYTLLEEPRRALPARLVLLPAQVTVKEISAGGVADLVPEWTRQATDNIQAELAQLAGQRQDFRLVPSPDLSAPEQERLEDYLASYMVVGITAHNMTTQGGAEWEHKRRHFDYTLGEGLAFIRERSGADAAVVVVAEDYVSSQGRKAAMFLGALVGVGIPGGQSILSVGVVDLANGDILWMHHAQSHSKDLKDREAVREMLTDILASYPGLDRQDTAP